MKGVKMSKLGQIHQQAQENINEELGSVVIPDDCYEEAIVEEAKRIMQSEVAL